MVEGLKDFWAHNFGLGEGGCVSGWHICDQQHSLSRDLGTIGQGPLKLISCFKYVFFEQCRW